MQVNKEKPNIRLAIRYYCSSYMVLDNYQPGFSGLRVAMSGMLFA